jgi:UDP-N-acetyl-D-mannosaminuronic acid dehydrogenase
MGLGYIGLPTAALIASKGIQVCGVDVSDKIVETINKGQIHIVEPDLDGLVNHVVKKGLLKASTAPKKADVFLIAVPTPFKSGYVPDLTYVESAIKMIAPCLKKGDLVVIESTSPVGTTEKMYNLLQSLRPELFGEPPVSSSLLSSSQDRDPSILMAYCPERVLPGRILYELEHNDRVIGGINQISTEKAREFYSLFVRGELFETNSKTAEMCKLVENAYRDVNIAFANELSLICEKAGINVRELIKLANRHPRVNILQPGVGVGGHCIAVDPWFLITQYSEESRLMKTAREQNIGKTKWVIEKIAEEALKFKELHGKGPRIGCFGLTYKPDIDDLRESPALEIVKQLSDDGFEVLPVDPNVTEVEGFSLIDMESALQQSDLIVFLVAHKEFKNLKTKLSEKLVKDFCGVLEDDN